MASFGIFLLDFWGVCSLNWSQILFFLFEGWVKSVCQAQHATIVAKSRIYIAKTGIPGRPRAEIQGFTSIRFTSIRHPLPKNAPVLVV